MSAPVGWRGRRSAVAAVSLVATIIAIAWFSQRERESSLEDMDDLDISTLRKRLSELHAQLADRVATIRSGSQEPSEEYRDSSRDIVDGDGDDGDFEERDNFGEGARDEVSASAPDDGDPQPADEEEELASPRMQPAARSAPPQDVLMTESPVPPGGITTGTVLSIKQIKHIETDNPALPKAEKKLLAGDEAQDVSDKTHFMLWAACAGLGIALLFFFFLCSTMSMKCICKYIHKVSSCVWGVFHVIGGYVSEAWDQFVGVCTAIFEFFELIYMSTVEVCSSCC